MWALRSYHILRGPKRGFDYLFGLGRIVLRSRNLYVLQTIHDQKVQYD